MRYKPETIHEDDSVLVVSKPGGMPSASLKEDEKSTLAAWLLDNYPELANLPKGKLEAGLVNRLDNETSGIVLAAKTTDAYEKLRKQFVDGEVEKEYLALVVGSPPEKGEIDTPIAHHPRKKKKMVACDSDERTKEWKGRPAHTEFESVDRYSYGGENDFTLLSVRISTGVRHQIRVHLAHIGFPIAGDALYMNPKKRAEDTLGIPRHFLHASKLAFIHPVTGEGVSFESPLAEDLKSVLESLSRR